MYNIKVAIGKTTIVDNDFSCVFPAPKDLFEYFNRSSSYFERVCQRKNILKKTGLANRFTLEQQRQRFFYLHKNNCNLCRRKAAERRL